MKRPDNYFSGIPRKNFSLLTALILVFTGLIVYSNIYSNGFHLDDFHTLVFNSHVHSLEEIPSFYLSGKGFSGTPFVSGYRPVTATVNALNYALSQTHPPLYHLINLIIHLLSSFLVSQIAFSLSGVPSVSLLSGLLFLVHPMNTEAVNYISARSSSLSTFFYLAAFLTFLYYRKENKKKWAFFSLVIFVFSLLSKEVSVTFPLLVIAYDYFFSPELPFSRKLKSWFLYLTPALLFLIVRHYFIHPMTGLHSASASLMENHLIDNIKIIFLGSLYLSTHYLFLYLFPYPLSFDHPFPKPEFDSTSVFFLFFWILIVFLIIIYRRKRLIPFLSGWFIITLLPLFLLPAISTLSLFQENRSYLSGAAISILLAMGVIEILNNSLAGFSNRFPWFPPFLVICLLTASSLASYHRNQTWKSEVTLWSDALQKNPASFISSFSLGYGYLTEGHMEKADYYFKKSLELSPPKEYLYYIHNNLGAVYEYRGEMEKAFSEYQTAVTLSPRLPEAHLNLGNFYSKKGAYEEAAGEMGTAIDMEYGHMEQRVRTAIEMENHGAHKEALQLFLKISKELPPSAEYKSLRNLIEEHLQENNPY